jgi:hypothetical protein
LLEHGVGAEKLSLAPMLGDVAGRCTKVRITGDLLAREIDEPRLMGAGLSERFDAILEDWGVPIRVAEPLACVVVIGAITCLSVIIGELVPKQDVTEPPE